MRGLGGRAAAAVTLAATLAACTQDELWPGAEQSVDRAALVGLLETGAPARSAEDYGICGAALAFDAKRTAPDSVAFSDDHTAAIRTRLLLLQLRSPDPGLSMAVGRTIFDLAPSERRLLAGRVPDCRARYGSFG